MTLAHPFCRRCLHALLLALATLATHADSWDDLELVEPETVLTTEGQQTLEQLRMRPHHLELQDGTWLSGSVSSFAHGKLRFRQAKAELTLPKDRIASLQLPGRELLQRAEQLANEEDAASALDLSHAVYRFWLPYLDLMPPDDVDALTTVVALNLRFGDPYLAVGAARRLQDFASSPTAAERLAELELLGIYRLPIKSQAKALAADAVRQAEPYDSTALPFFILARLHFDAREFSEALHLSLEPIVFSTHLPMDYLPHCYVLAIAAFGELNRPQEARRLAQEMRERALSWPAELAGFNAARTLFHEVGPTKSSTNPSQ